LHLSNEQARVLDPDRDAQHFEGVSRAQWIPYCIKENVHEGLPIALHLQVVCVEKVGEPLVDNENFEEVRFLQCPSDGQNADVLDLLNLDQVWIVHLRIRLEELAFFHFFVEVVRRLKAGNAEPEKGIRRVHNLPTRWRHVARQDHRALRFPVLLLQSVKFAREQHVVHYYLDMLSEIL